ncbi:protein phosphatase inhibitor 2, partial [Phenoliferia sp. Uapishka_3]
MDQTDSPMSAPAPPPPIRQNSSSSAMPRGILKNATTSKGGAVVWDEENLAVNELAKDSTMKIDEPKTPWVNYNAETDEVMDLDKIPGFELGKAEYAANGADYGSAGTPPSPSRSVSSSGPNSRRGSEASEKMVKVEAPHGAPSSGEEDDDDELQDPESTSPLSLLLQNVLSHSSQQKQLVPTARSLLKCVVVTTGLSHPFPALLARLTDQDLLLFGRNEAEAMKRAQALLEEEESSGGDSTQTPTNGSAIIPPVPSLPKYNGA